MIDEPSEYMRFAAAARLLGTSRQNVSDLVKRKVLRAYELVPGVPVVRRVDVLAYKAQPPGHAGRGRKRAPVEADPPSSPPDSESGDPV